MVNNHMPNPEKFRVHRYTRSTPSTEYLYQELKRGHAVVLRNPGWETLRLSTTSDLFMYSSHQNATCVGTHTKLFPPRNIELDTFLGLYPVYETTLHGNYRDAWTHLDLSIPTINMYMLIEGQKNVTLVPAAESFAHVLADKDAIFVACEHMVSGPDCDVATFPFAQSFVLHASDVLFFKHVALPSIPE